jgi:hypothetical protein
MKANRIATAALSVLPVVIQPQNVSIDSAAWWRDAARKDIAAAREIMSTKFITALNSPGQSWTQTLEAAVQGAERDVDRVQGVTSYQSVLKRFVGAFDDAHVRVRFTGTRVIPSVRGWKRFRSPRRRPRNEPSRLASRQRRTRSAKREIRLSGAPRAAARCRPCR